ncbi:S8/S53 family peptidase [Streptomyces sp. NPDC006984]|uniref:S8/S53 family peptidase n=1 Tax=Streptomyces sp. NPDC006984 TaxID=3155463 RepID=UPI0033C01982
MKEFAHGPEHECATAIGPRFAIEDLIQTWPLIRTELGLGRLNPPRLIDFGDEGIPQDVRGTFQAPRSPAVAVLKHPPGLGIELTTRLQIESMLLPSTYRSFPLADGMPSLLWEPAYQFQAAAQGGSGPKVDPFNTGKLNDLTASAPAVTSHAKGHRVALLDTGHKYATQQMIDFLDGDLRNPTTRAAVDPHGHGTAVSMVLGAVNPRAIVHPLRVLNDKGKGRSHEILAGLTYAMWSGQYDLINASLTTIVSNPCDTTYGRSIDYLFRYCQANAINTPMLVAAAGNGNGSPSGYPARMHGAVVALATDQHKKAQPYNSRPPAHAVTESAYGGSASDPLGDLGPLTGITGAGASLWGTSLAAPVISGAYLPP